MDILEGCILNTLGPLEELTLNGLAGVRSTVDVTINGDVAVPKKGMGVVSAALDSGKFLTIYIISITYTKI